MQHQAWIASEKSRAVDAQRQIRPDPRTRVAIYHRVRIVLAPASQH
jgi:hypothetical protein